MKGPRIDTTILQAKLIQERDLDIRYLPADRVDDVVRRHFTQAGVSNAADYARLLDKDPDEYLNLLRELIVPPDRFFGDAELSSLLQEQLIPNILAQKQPHDRIRIWIVQCGEAYIAYDVATLLWEALGKDIHQYDLAVITTDADEKAVKRARSQSFTVEQLKNTRRLKSYIEKKGSKLSIATDIRRLITFGVHDTVIDPPYPRVDMVLALGYLPLLEPAARERVRSKLIHSLVEGGRLVLGRGEILELRDESATQTQPFPVFIRQVAHPPGRMTMEPKQPVPIERSQLEVMTTPTFVVDAAGRIIDTNEAARKSLRYDGTLAGCNIDRLQPETMFSSICNAVDTVKSAGRSAVIHRLKGWVGAAAPAIAATSRRVSTLVVLLPCSICLEDSEQAREARRLYEEIALNTAETTASLWAHRYEVVQLRRQASIITETLYNRTEQLNRTKEELESRNVELLVTLQELTDTVQEREKAELVVHEALDRERRIAKTLQEALLPPVNPRAGEFQMAVNYRAAWEEAEVGGDFYHYAALPNDVSFLLLGDVSGKGLEAAVHSSMAKFIALGYAQETPAPDILLMRLNEALSIYTQNSTFVTLVYLMLDLKTHNIHYGSAGHEPVVHYSQAAGETSLLMPTGRALGVAPQATYTSQEIVMGHGDILLVYTDGISEAGFRTEMLGPEGIALIVQENASEEPQQILDVLFKTATQYAGGKLRDDAAAVIVKRE